MTFDISRQRVDWRRQQSATIPVVDGGMDTAECGFVHTSQLFLPHIVGHDCAAAALSHHNIHRQLGSSTPRPRRLTSSRCRDGSQNSRNWENENTLLLCSFVVKGTRYNAPWVKLKIKPTPGNKLTHLEFWAWMDYVSILCPSFLPKKIFLRKKVPCKHWITNAEKSEKWYLLGKIV